MSTKKLVINSCLGRERLWLNEADIRHSGASTEAIALHEDSDEVVYQTEDGRVFIAPYSGATPTEFEGTVGEYLEAALSAYKEA